MRSLVILAALALYGCQTASQRSLQVEDICRTLVDRHEEKNMAECVPKVTRELRPHEKRHL
jgi:hypothetical protein